MMDSLVSNTWTILKNALKEPHVENATIKKRHTAGVELGKKLL